MYVYEHIQFPYVSILIRSFVRSSVRMLLPSLLELMYLLPVVITAFTTVAAAAAAAVFAIFLFNKTPSKFMYMFFIGIIEESTLLQTLQLYINKR